MLDFIINEKAGEKKAVKARKIIQRILDEKNIEYRFHSTKYRRNAIEIASELSRNGAECIIAAGGDGTVNEVLNGIDTEKVKFGIIPCGSGNDFADTAKLPLDPAKALDIILNGQVKPTDFLVCGGVRCMNIVGAGIDVEILKRCENSKILKGKLKYVVSLLISLIKFKFYGFTLFGDKLDGKKCATSAELAGQGGEHRSAMIVCAGNGKKFGGGIPMCPQAELDDGLMDFIVIDEMKKINMIKAFIHLMKGDILKEPYCDFTRREHIVAKFDRPVAVQIDGEIYENLDFDVHIEKAKLQLYRP